MSESAATITIENVAQISPDICGIGLSDVGVDYGSWTDTMFEVQAPSDGLWYAEPPFAFGSTVVEIHRVNCPDDYFVGMNWRMLTGPPQLVVPESDSMV